MSFFSHNISISHLPNGTFQTLDQYNFTSASWKMLSNLALETSVLKEKISAYVAVESREAEKITLAVKNRASLQTTTNHFER